MGASCSIGAAKAFQALKQSDNTARKSSDLIDGMLNVEDKHQFANFAYENWLSSSTLKTDCKRFKSLEMPTGLDALFEDILLKCPLERPYVEPETEIESRKRQKQERLDKERGIPEQIIRETLSEQEACGGRYLRIFVWSNVEATLVHQALHEIVIPQITEVCKRVGVCIVWVDFRWASSSTLTAESASPYLCRKTFADMQQMVEAEMERCFSLSPLLNFLSMTAEENDAKSTLGLPLRVPKFIISRWIKASRTLAAAFIEKAYPNGVKISDPMAIIQLDVEVEEGDRAAAEETQIILESICSGGSSKAEEDTIAITNEMIASMISDPTEFMLRRRMKLEIGSDSGLFPLSKCKSMLSYCYYGCFDRVFSARSAIKQKRPEIFQTAVLAKKETKSRELEPMNRLPRLMELLFDMRNNVQFFHLRNNFALKSGLEDHVTHFCSSATEHIIERLKLAISEQEKYLPGVLEGQRHFRFARDATLSRRWDTATVAIVQLCWLPDVARDWRHQSSTITDCLAYEKRSLETSEEFTEKELFKKASQSFSPESYDSEYNTAAMKALNDDYEETNFWRLLDEKKKLQGNLSGKQRREKRTAMTVSAKDLFVQEASQIEANAKQSELKETISKSLESFVTDYGLLADMMSIKRHGCILMYDQGDSSTVPSILNAIGALKTKIMALPNWKKNHKFNVVTRGAMIEDAVCSFSDLVTSICEELAGQSISHCDQIQSFMQNDFTNRSEAQKLSVFLQAIPEEQPTVIFCYGIQSLFQTDKISSDICPESLPRWVLLIFHSVCPTSRTAETFIRSSFRGKSDIFGALSQSSRNSYVAMVEQLFMAGCKPLESHALSLLKSAYCGKQGIITTRCHIFMFGKCMEWGLFANDPGLLKISAEMRDRPNQVIVKHYILGVAQIFRLSKTSVFAVLSLMAASRSEVPFKLIVAFVKFVKRQTSETLAKGFHLSASSSSKDVSDVLSAIHQGMMLSEPCSVRATEWIIFFEQFKILMSPTALLRGSDECWSLHDGILKHDVQFATEGIVSQQFSKMVLLASRYNEPWKIQLATSEKQVINAMKIRDLLPVAVDLGLQTFVLQLLLDFDFVSHYFEAGLTTQLEMLYIQAGKFSSCPELIRCATVLVDVQRFLAYNRSLFMSGQKYDLLSLLFNFNGCSMYFDTILKFRELKTRKGEAVNSIWIKNKSEYGKRNTLRWTADAHGEVRAWFLMNELNFRYCAVSIDMPEPRLLILDSMSGQTIWMSPDNLIAESQVLIKTSTSNEFLVSCSKARVYLWKKIGTYADSGYCAVHSFQLLKHQISGLDLSPNDSNFCTYSHSEGLTVTAWSIITDIGVIDKLHFSNLAVTSVYHTGLSSILKFACFLAWENVLLTSESSGEMTLWYIHKSKFGLSSNPGSSLSEIIRWTIPQNDSSEKKATSVQWLQEQNILVLSDLNFVIFYHVVMDFQNAGVPIASVSFHKKLIDGFAPSNWYATPILSVIVLDPSLPELGMNLGDENRYLQGTLLAVILTEKSVSVWSTEPDSNLPEQIMIEFEGYNSAALRMMVKRGGSLILNCADKTIVQRDLEVSRYGMIDNNPANGCIDDIHFTANDKMIVCSCKSGEVLLYSGDSGYLKLCAMMNQNSISVCSSFCELMSLIYSGDRNGNIHCFNTKSRGQLPDLKHHQSMVTAIAVSPSDLMLASGDDVGNITLWSTRSGQNLLNIPDAHSDSVTHLKFSHDSSTIWSSSADGRVASWLCKDGKALRASRISDGSAQSFDCSDNM
jgi:hypothetical protein